MITTNGNPDLQKMNLYRLGIGETLANTLADADPAVFCKNYAAIAPARLMALRQQLTNSPSPMGDNPNLFMFLVARGTATYMTLNYQQLTGLPDPFAALAQ